MNNPGIEADFFNHGLSWSANETVPVKLLLVNTPATGAPTITGTPHGRADADGDGG